MVKVIVDPGSCHYRQYRHCISLIEAAKFAGADAIKFQMFKNLPPNIALPYEWMPELIEFGRDIDIEVFASVWDQEGYDVLKECGCKSIKFSYSQRNSSLLEQAISDFENIYTSNDVIYPNIWGSIINIVQLYCVPEYPVKRFIDFKGKFDDNGSNNFDGFSDHTLGFNQTLSAVRNGAKVIEKHFQLNGLPPMCPDATFALKYNKLKKMIIAIRRVKCES